MYCVKCGKEIKDDVNHCPYCGNATGKKGNTTVVSGKTYYVSDKNRSTAIALCLLGLIGLSGLHRIYVRNTLWGVLYFFTYGFFLIGTVVDLIRLFQNKFTDSDGYPLISSSKMGNYKKRTPPKTNQLTTYVIPAVVITFLSFCYILGMATKDTDVSGGVSNNNHTKITTVDVKYFGEEMLFEFIKEDCHNKRFDDAYSRLQKMKHEHPRSKYINLILNDYPELQQAEEQAKKEKQERAKIIAEKSKDGLNKFNQNMSSNGGAAFYEGYQTQQQYFVVYVNSNWYKLSREQKIGFGFIVQKEMVYNYIDEMFYYVKIKDAVTKDTVAEWNLDNQEISVIK